MTHAVRHVQWARGALVALAALVAFALSFAALPARGQEADKFSSNGDQIAGWYWLRDPGLSHYAEYTFDHPPPAGDIILEITALATDGVNGGRGVNAHFDLLVGFPGAGNMGGVFHKSGVTLQNVSPASDPVGYTCYGMITLKRSAIDRVMGANGALFVRIVRESRDPHVAFNGASVRIFDRTTGGWPPGDRLPPDGWLHRDGTGGDLLPPDGLLRDGTGGDLLPPDGFFRDGTGGGTVVTDGHGRQDGDGTDYRPDLGDFGDEGVCLVDRPCLGLVADGFRSTGFPGAEGWFWLRAPTTGQFAQYLFETPPAADALVLDIAVLGQNRPGSTPKDTVHVNLTLGYPGSGSLGGQIGPVVVELPSLWLGPDDDVWRARALVVLPHDQLQAVLPAVGGLFLSFDRVDAFEPDVAFSAASVLVYPAQDIGR